MGDGTLLVPLRPVTRDEFDEWLPQQEAGYARLIVAPGGMSAEAARKKAQQDTRRYFSGGFADIRSELAVLAAVTPTRYTPYIADRPAARSLGGHAWPRADWEEPDEWCQSLASGQQR